MSKSTRTRRTRIASNVKPKPDSLLTRRSSRIKAKENAAKGYPIRQSNLRIVLKVIATPPCSRDLVHGEELSLAQICRHGKTIFENTLIFASNCFLLQEKTFCI